MTPRALPRIASWLLHLSKKKLHFERDALLFFGRWLHPVPRASALKSVLWPARILALPFKNTATTPIPCAQDDHEDSLPSYSYIAKDNAFAPSILSLPMDASHGQVSWL